MAVFRGRYYHAIDEKGRIIFPVKLREIFAEKYNNQFVITGWDGYLLVFPGEEWEALEEKVFQQSLIRREVRAFQRLFMSGAVDCTFDRQGRVLVQPVLRDYAGLEKDVVIVGMGKSIEIWNKERFEADIEMSNQDIKAFSSFMADLGI